MSEHRDGRVEKKGVKTRQGRGESASSGALAGLAEGSPAHASPRAPSRSVEDDLAHPSGYLKACLLLLLEERPGHGYDLADRLRPLGYERDDPSRIYRALRALEGVGVLQPRWDTSGPGPARRIYDLTPLGWRMAAASVETLQARVEALEQHLARARRGRNDEGRRGAQFEVLIEAKVLVQAADESSARCIVERALRGTRELARDVWTTSNVWAYDARKVDGPAW